MGVVVGYWDHLTDSQWKSWYADRRIRFAQREQRLKLAVTKNDEYVRILNDKLKRGATVEFDFHALHTNARLNVNYRKEDLKHFVKLLEGMKGECIRRFGALSEELVLYITDIESTCERIHKTMGI